MINHIVAATLLLATAAPSSELIQDMAGAYQLLPADGRRFCAIELKAERSKAAWHAVAAPDCAARIPEIKTVVAWRPLDGIQLLDASGKPAMTFVEDETALPSYPDLQKPRYFLIPRIAGYTHVAQTADLIGTWQLRRRGGQACAITLGARSPATAARVQTVIMGQGCAGRSSPGKVSQWRTEAMTLLLEGANDAQLTFLPTSDHSFADASGDWTLSRP